MYVNTILLLVSTMTPKNNTKRAQKSAGKTNRGTKKMTNSVIPHPTQFNSTVRFTRKARFVCGTSSSTLNLTRAMLLNHLVVAKTTTTATRLLSGIRLAHIQIWYFPTGNAASEQYVPNTVSVEWTSTYGPSVIVSDTSLSIEPASILTKPPKDSLASFWSLTGTNESDVLAILTLLARTVIDITYECVLQNGETPVGLSPTTVMTAGAVYMSYLDGIAGSGNISPVSYSGIF